MSGKNKALFVCLGNICRSPIAEAVFDHVVESRGLKQKWEVDSAATGAWHIGKKPDSRALSTLQKHKVPYNNTARQVCENDFHKYDYIFGMDEANIADLKRLAPSDSKAKILLLGEFDPEGEVIIRDPYYDSGSEGFETCYQQCLRSVNGFLDQLK